MKDIESMSTEELVQQFDEGTLDLSEYDTGEWQVIHHYPDKHGIKITRYNVEIDDPLHDDSPIPAIRIVGELEINGDRHQTHIDVPVQQFDGVAHGISDVLDDAEQYIITQLLEACR